jgi:hypothetical protein
VPLDNPYEASYCIDLPEYHDSGLIPPPPIPCDDDDDCPFTDCPAGGGYCEVSPGCLEISDDEGNPAVWLENSYCESDPCAPWACYAGGGLSCCEAHPFPEVGCEDLLCCERICTEFGSMGRYCCEYNWDALCAELANEHCPECWKRNDECTEAIELVYDARCWNDPSVLCHERSNGHAT